MNTGVAGSSGRSCSAQEKLLWGKQRSGVSWDRQVDWRSRGSLRAAVGSSNSGSGSSVALHSGQSYGGSTGGVVCLFSDGSDNQRCVMLSTSNVGSTGSSGCLFFSAGASQRGNSGHLSFATSYATEAQQAQYRWQSVVARRIWWFSGPYSGQCDVSGRLH